MVVPLENRRRDERPWGYFEQFTREQVSTVKILHINAGEEFSLQMHAHRDEFWRTVSGSGSVIIGEDSHNAKAGDEFWIPRGTKHRARADRDSDLELLEISFGDFDENDIVRLEDKYGRI